MNKNSLAGLALIASIAGLAVTMLFHPTGHDILTSSHAAAVSTAVHALALATIPLALFGFFVFSRQLPDGSGGPAFAYITYAFGVVAAMGAAVASGFIATSIGSEMREASGAELETLRALFRAAGDLNQTFARMHILAASVAILVWSTALWRTGARGTALLGFVAGSATLLAVGSGHLTLNVHGAGAVYLAHGVWTIAVAILLIRQRIPPSTRSS